MGLGLGRGLGLGQGLGQGFTIHSDETRAIEVRAVSIKFRTKNLEFRISNL